MTVAIRRCWINQPSTLQPLHEYHGLNVLVASNHEGYPTVIYFLGGPVVSTAGDYRLCLAEGWRI